MNFNTLSTGICPIPKGNKSCFILWNILYLPSKFVTEWAHAHSFEYIGDAKLLLMDTEPLEHTLSHLIEPLLISRDLELVELAASGGHRRKIVRIFIHRPTGVTVDECASLSREIADLFDTRDPIAGGYVLEVSTPGLTRPLKTDRDFERVVGKPLRLVVDGLGVEIATLLDVTPDHLNVELKGEPLVIDRAKIQKATVHFKL